MESKEYNKLVNIAKKKQTHRYRKQTSGYQWGEGKGKGKHRGREKIVYVNYISIKLEKKNKQN